MRSFFQKIVESPEPVRRRFFFFFFLLSLPLVLVIWAFSLKVSLGRITPQDQFSTRSLKKIVGDFKEGLSSVSGIFSEINVRMPFENGALEPEPATSRPRTHFPLE